MSTFNRGRFWALLCLLTVVMLLTAGYHWLLANLDDPRVKGMVNSYLREHRGVEIDYDRLELSPLGGRLVIEGLRVLSPLPYRENAPLFLVLDRLAARWSPGSLLRQEILIQEVQLTGLALHWVQGADGQTILDFFHTEAVPSEPVPLSHTLQMADLPRALRVESFTLSGLMLTWSEVDSNGAVLHQGTFEGLEAAAQLGVAPGAVTAQFELHSPPRAEGTRLAYREASQDTPQEADLRLGLRLQVADSRTVETTVEIDLLRQSFAEALAKTGRIFEMQATATFNARAQASRFVLEHLTLFDNIAQANFSAVFADDSPIPVLEAGTGSFHLDPLLATWPGLIAGIEGEKVHLDYHIDTEPVDGRSVPKLKISGGAGRLVIERGEQAAEVQGLSLYGEGAAMSPDCAAFSLRLPVDSLWMRTGDEHQVRLTAVNIAFAASELDFRREDPLHSSGQLEAAVDIMKAQARLAGIESTFRGIALRAASALEGERRFAPKVELPVAKMAVYFPEGHQLLAERLALKLRLEDFSPHQLQPFFVAATGDAHDLKLKMPQRRFEIDSAGLGLHATFSPQGKVSARGLFPLTGLRIAQGSGALKPVVGYGQLRWSLDELLLDKAKGLPAAARLNMTGTFDNLSMEAAATLHGHRAETRFTLETKALGALAHLVSPELRQESGISLEQLGLTVQGEGVYQHLDRPGSLALQQGLEAQVQDLVLQGPELHAVLPAVSLRARHRGEAGVHKAVFAVELDQTYFNQHLYEGPLRLLVRTKLATQAPRAQFALRVDGPQGAAVDARVIGEIDSATSALRHQASLQVSRGGGIIALLPSSFHEAYPLDWDALAVSLRSEGQITGLLEMEAGAPLPVFIKSARDTLIAQQQLEAQVDGIAYTANNLTAQLPQVHLSVSGEKRAGRLEGTAAVKIPHLAVQAGANAFTLEGMAHQLRFSAASRLAEGDLEIHLDSRLAAAQQAILPFYPIRDLTLSGRLHLDRLSVLELDEFVLTNPAGGTRLELSKTLQRSRGRALPEAATRASNADAAAVGAVPKDTSLHKLAFRGQLSQSLEMLNASPGLFQGKGMLVAPLTLYSMDGSLFDITAALRLDGVEFRLPAIGLEVAGANGNILVEETVEWDPEEGFSVVPHSTRNTFARVRFQDVQPFLSRQSFLNIDKAVWKDVVMGPIAGSLQIQRNVFAVNQLKIQKGKGALSGQLVLDYLPGAERIKFRGNATGLRLGSRNERLDGNLALVFLPATLELNGRVQILRLSRQHLLELLDLLDPFREDPSFNRLRRVLVFGHPSFVRLEMSQGLMSMKVNLGGMAALIRMDTIRGIALGPLMNRHIAPLLP